MPLSVKKNPRDSLIGLTGAILASYGLSRYPITSGRISKFGVFYQSVVAFLLLADWCCFCITPNQYWVRSLTIALK
jgi:hypothetical protein